MTGLEEKLANSELISSKAQAELEFYRKELNIFDQVLSNSKAELNQQLEAEKKSKADIIRQFEIQAEEIKEKAVAEFRQSELFTGKFLKIQGSAIAVGQTWAIDACS